MTAITNMPSKKKKSVKKKTKQAVSKKNAKRPARKAAKKGAAPKVVNMPKPVQHVQGKPIGEVTHFYTAIKVAIVKFKKPVHAGTALRYKGATTDFAETAKSMQYDHKPVAVAPKGKQVGIKVGKRVREGDLVYLA